MSITPHEEAQALAQAGTGILPVGAAGLASQPFAQTFDRRFALSTLAVITSAQLVLTAIWLPAGRVITGITFVSGPTGESVGSHLWYALYQQNLTLMAQTADNTGATAFAANTAFRMALTTPQTCAYSGLYYLGFCCVATVPPTLLNITAITINANGGITGMTPVVAATSTGSLTGTAPNPAGALTAIGVSLYAFVD